jgi:hypothetical protein
MTNEEEQEQEQENKSKKSKLDHIPQDCHFNVGLSIGSLGTRRRNNRINKIRTLKRTKKSTNLFSQSINNISNTNIVFKDSLLLPCKYSCIGAHLSAVPPTYVSRKNVLKMFTDLRNKLLLETFEQREFRQLVRLDHLVPFYSDEVRYLTNYIKEEQRFRFQIRRLVNAYIYKKYSHRFFNKEDPVTFFEPETPIFLFNSKQRGSYVFDANSLSRLVTTSLIKHSYMFPSPQIPKNPLTNVEFTIAELIDIVSKLKSHKQSSWAIEGFISCKYILKKFKLKFLSVIKHEALSEYLKSTSDDAIDHLIDFIEFALDQYDIENPALLRVLRWIAKEVPDEPYIRKWKECYRQYYEINITYPSLTFDDDMYTNVYSTIGRLMFLREDITRVTLIMAMAAPTISSFNL